MCRIVTACLALAAGAAVMFAPAAAAEPAYRDPTGVYSGGPVPTMNGVPCVAGHLGTCLAFQQNQPRGSGPRSTFGHSPTVRR